MFVQNGFVIRSDTAFSLTDGGITINFSSGWLASSTEEDRAKYGITIVPDDSIRVVPFSVTPGQIRMALLTMGMLDAIEAYIATATRQEKIWWEFATSFERTNSFVVAMGDKLGLTPEQVDDVFVLAGTPNV